MRKIIHIAFAILKSGKPFDPTLGLHEGAIRRYLLGERYAAVYSSSG